jgi:uncharacterized membrane protein YhhN
MGPGLPILACTIAVVGLLVAERRGSQRGKWIAKPLASCAFVTTALAAGALDDTYGRWILLGLVLSLAGDVLLIPTTRPKVFRAGVFAFLLGHVAFIAAFLTQPLDARALAAAAVVLGLLLLVVWRALAGSIPADMKRPVIAYFGVIGTMAVLACAVTGAGGPPTVALGALAFTASDVSVARDRFVQHEYLNRAWGLPLYYSAQILLALTTAVIQ